eukprot:COSAG05_NODE_1558_length_4564_cov_5.087794_7_plen_65_part_00
MTSDRQSRLASFTCIHMNSENPPNRAFFLTLSQVTNFRDHDAPDRLRDTKACQKESFHVIICII